MYHCLHTHTRIRRDRLLSDLGNPGEIGDQKNQNEGQFIIKQELLGNICGLLEGEGAVEWGEMARAKGEVEN